jgi:6-phosphogluconolactonase (cycloisomerase 2 family)
MKALGAARILLASLALLVGLPVQAALGNAPGSLQQLAGPNNCFQQTGGSDCGTHNGVGLVSAKDVVVSPDGKNVYVIGGSDDAIAEFARDADGSLAPLASPNNCIAWKSSSTTTCPNKTVNGMVSPRAIAITPDGENIYVVARDDFGNGTIVEFARNADGSLTQLAPNDCIAENFAQTGVTSSCANQSGHGIFSPAALAVSPDGRNVYVADDGKSAIAEFARSAGGGLTQLSGANDCITEHGDGSTDCTTTGNGLTFVDSVVVSPDGSNVYAGSDTSGTVPGAIAEFARNADGSLTQLAGPHNCVQESGGADCGTETGVGINFVVGLTVSPDGRNLYSSSGNGDQPIAEFTRNVDGSLTQLASPNNCIEEHGGADGCGTTGHGLNDGGPVKVSPDGADVYTVASTDDCGPCGAAVAEFARNPNGSLTQLASPDNCIQQHDVTNDCGNNAGHGLGDSGIGIPGLAIAPDGSNAYVTGPDDVAEFARTSVHHTLNVSLTGSGNGSVLDGTGAISCPSACSHAYTAGTVVSLTATSALGSTFTGWSGGGCGGTGACQVIMNADMAVTATFTGVPGPPAVVATGAPVITSTTSAVFSATVNPEGLTTSVVFEYGPQLPNTAFSYTSTTPPQPVGPDFSNHTVSATATGLLPHTLYHFRAIASNNTGTTNGLDQTLTTPADPPPPPPVLGKSFDVTPLSGIVYVKLPGGLPQYTSDVGAHASAPLTKGVGFEPLTEARQLPSGTQVDARAGTLLLSAASATRHGKLQTGTFGGGVFGVSQDRRGVTKGLTTLSLLEGAFQGGPTYASCKTKRAADPSAFAALSSAVINSMKTNVHGKFRTKGKYGAATARSTAWTMTDRCDGTLTVATRGTVTVQDFVRHVKVIVRAGHRYLARASRRR